MNKSGLRAKKIKDYLIEPVKEGPNAKWEGHHATNPCVIRFGEDPRVFLGYRAGGDDDYYRHGRHNTWGSHLGLAVMDDCGLEVIHRLPLPIMKKVHNRNLPQTEEAFDDFVSKYGDEILILHDFRFFGYEDYLYVIFHESNMKNAFDCIVRMKVTTFIEKVNESIKLMESPVEQIIDRWHQLWWADDVWQPCGVDGTNRIFSSPVCKGDIIFFALGNGTLQMCHRPFADGMAVLNTGNDTFAKATPDGITAYGSLETCIRPSSLDNSHIGNNGSPTRAQIGDVDVYIDVTHGCHNRMLSEEGFDEYEVHYYPYLRVKDFQTGELLYYSEDPILDYCRMWREYAEDGEWVSQNKLLGGVMFSGGQLELVNGRNGLDDEFITYIGLGDTAVGAATFKLRDLLPQQVIEDIQKRKAHQQVRISDIEPNRYCFDKAVNGWKWHIENNSEKRCINIVRTLNKDGYHETATRAINTVPGSYDADAIIFDGTSICHFEQIGWLLIYKGVRWDVVDGEKISSIGYGLLILDENNPEMVLYRSTEPLDGKVTKIEGWDIGPTRNDQSVFFSKAAELIPELVVSRLKRRIYLKKKGLLFGSQMVIWQQQKSGLIPIGIMPGMS